MQRVRNSRTQLGGAAASDAAPAVGSAAASRAAFLFSQPVRYAVGERARLQKDLTSIISQEDAELHVIDRGLTAAELDWLRSAPPGTALRLLVYEIERETASRTSFVRSLQQFRSSRPGAVAVRAVKIAGHERTPLERYVLCGSDWAVELTHSLSTSGQREISVVSLSPMAFSVLQRELIDRYWSVSLLAADPHKCEVHLLDL